MSAASLIAIRKWYAAWQPVGHGSLSGEAASCGGAPRANSPFTIDRAGWGAFERVARHGELDLDDEALPLFAGPANGARRAQAWSLGLNGTLAQHCKRAANHTHASSGAGAADGAEREDEKALLPRARPAP